MLCLSEDRKQHMQQRQVTLSTILDINYVLFGTGADHKFTSPFSNSCVFMFSKRTTFENVFESLRFPQRFRAS